MIGEKAHIIFNNGSELIADRNPNETFDFGNVKQYWSVGHKKEIKDYYESLANNVSPRNTAKEVMPTQELICEIYRLGRKNFRSIK